MSQAAETDAATGTLGKKNLTTMHAVAQALAIGPMFSVALILGGVSRPDIGAGWNAALAVLLAGLGVLAIAYTISLYARKYAGAGAVYEYLTHGAHPWVGVFTAGFFFVGALFLGGGGIYLGLGVLSDNFWKAHISDSGPAWWIWGMIALAIVLVLNYFGVRLAIRAMLTFAVISFIPMLILAVVIIAKGGQDGNTLTMFNPNETSLFGITGGGVLGGILLGILLFVGFEAAASIGEESEDPHRSIPRALIGTVAVAAAFFVLMSYAFSIGYGRKAVSAGRMGILPQRGRRHGDEVRRIVVRDDPRDRRHPRRDGARARDLRDDRARLLRPRARRTAALVLREDLEARHALGRQPDGRGRGHRADAARLRHELRHAVRRHRPGRQVHPLLPERPVRDLHPLGHDRLVRDRARLPRARRRGAPDRALERQQAVAVRDRPRGDCDSDPRLLRRPQPRASRQLELQLGRRSLDARSARRSRRSGS